jgi:transposase
LPAGRLRTQAQRRPTPGQRLLAKAPFGYWKTQTFIASLRCDALITPLVIAAPIDRRIFETEIETHLASDPSTGRCRHPRQFARLYNLPAYKSAAAEAAIRAKGAWRLFLPPHSPDLNPIKQLFAKFKTLLRARAIRTIDALGRAIGAIRDLFTPQERQNNFAAAPYRFISTSGAR